MKNKSLSIRLAAVLSATLLGAGLAAGCGTDKATTQEDEVIENDVVDDSEDADTANVDTDDENETSPIINAPDFNHGYSISVRQEKGYDEIARSYETVIHDSDEALAYLEKLVPSQGTEFTYELTDTSDDDPGAYMWYKFIACYKGIEVENAEFTVIAFTDGTIAEGRTEFLTCSFADKSEALGRKKALSLYAESTGDKKKYKYKGARYFFSGKGNIECPYVYLYRYNSGTMFENCTLIINAATGELIGKWADAIS